MCREYFWTQIYICDSSSSLCVEPQHVSSLNRRGNGVENVLLMLQTIKRTLTTNRDLRWLTVGILKGLFFVMFSAAVIKYPLKPEWLLNCHKPKIKLKSHVSFFFFFVTNTKLEIGAPPGLQESFQQLLTDPTLSSHL